ncbi:MAG: DUF6056 family protein [Prevotella sp.]|jgi:hypothetical protein|nr:DUF6056 family protein [Prevotella sp.]
MKIEFINMEMNSKVKKWLFVTVICFIFGFIYILNSLIPLYYDDLCYAFVFGGGPKVSGLADVIRSQYNHYFLWGGRSVVHVIAQILILLPERARDIINTLAFIGLVLIIYKIANRGNKLSISVLIVTTLLIYFFSPVFVTTLLWITGSSNYLWGTLITLAFVYPYCKNFIDGKTETSIWKVVLFFLFGIITGWTNENTSLALICITVAFCVLFYRKHTLSSWNISGLIGLVIGFIVMMAAPGNFRREQASYDADYTLFNRLFDGVKYMSHAYSVFILIILAIYVVLLLINIYQDKKDWYKNRHIQLSFCFFFFSHLSIFLLSGVPGVHPRAFFGGIVYLIVGVVILYARIQINTSFLRLLNLSAITLFCLAFCYSYYRRLPSFLLISKTYNNREQVIEEQKKKGVEDFVFYDKIKLHYKFDFNDLSDNPDDPYNIYYAKIHNIHSIKILDSEKK